MPFKNKCFYFLSVAILLSNINGLKSKKIRHKPAPEFKTYSIVIPEIQHQRYKRGLSSNGRMIGSHPLAQIIKYKVGNRDYVMDLKIDVHLLDANHTIEVQTDNNKTVVHKPDLNELDICHYRGVLVGEPGSWVAVSTCRGLRGVVYDGEHLTYIEPTQGKSMESLHYVYSHSNLKNTETDQAFRCGTGSRAANNTEQSSRTNQYSLLETNRRFKRENLVPYYMSSNTRFIQLTIVADKSFYESIDGGSRKEKIANLHLELKNFINIVNAIYNTLDIYVVLTGVRVWDSRDEIDVVTKSETTLDNFIEYRKTFLLQNMNSDATVFITRTEFDNNVLGQAYVGSICDIKSAVVLYRHSNVAGLVAAIIAHELGHVMGMEHDTSGCGCPERNHRCVMHDTLSEFTPTHWSSCSKEYLLQTYDASKDYCLRNIPTKLFSSRTCGNGIVEHGEQCDCGLVTVGYTEERALCFACCHADTCTLRAHAACAAGQCCNLQTCGFRPASTECRSAKTECDLPEYCTGDSEICPKDVHKMDSTPCGPPHNEAFCANGKCFSHDKQCKLIWGSSGRNGHPKCYHDNLLGNEIGNCGRFPGRYKNCAPEDVMCGVLKCWKTSMWPQFKKYTEPHVRTHTEGNRMIHCFTVLEKDNSGLMTLDGAKCGDGKMCMQQRCRTVVSIKKDIEAKLNRSICPSNCSGNGICDSEGECHCEAGFAPPLCDAPGAGGSRSSGPATDVTTLKRFATVMYITFLGIVPASALVTFALFYYNFYGIKELKCWKSGPN